MRAKARVLTAGLHRQAKRLFNMRACSIAVGSANCEVIQKESVHSVKIAPKLWELQVVRKTWGFTPARSKIDLPPRYLETKEGRKFWVRSSLVFRFYARVSRMICRMSSAALGMLVPGPKIALTPAP